MLRKNPGFTAAAVLTLALGVGACTAIFALINAALLRTLRFPDSARLVFLARDRFEFHFDESVFDANRISRFARLFQDVRLRWRGFVGNDGPLWFAFAGFCGSPAGRLFASLGRVEVY